MFPSIAPPVRLQVGGVLCFTPRLPRDRILSAIRIRIRMSPLREGIPVPLKSLPHIPAPKVLLNCLYSLTSI